MSGLKVNFHKSSLVGVNVSQNWLLEAANVLNCGISSLPISYLGLPIGANPKRMETWSHVINTVKSRLSGWKNKHLSVGGRILILKLVLYAIPVYFLSFFKAPTGAWSSICNWLGVSSAMHNEGWQHMSQFENLFGGGKATSLKLLVLWCACIWCIWKARNHKIFRNEEIQIIKVIEEAKVYSWKLLKIKSKLIKDDFVMWCLNPKACLDLTAN
ncbi:uncharacterized protein LOC131623225 [Vicia villosa]|uniref:uncharacterized protein LOC131623225 n=1 Tax=Vicia villosa TaxID=3911 RepID=UPI00273AADFF|nr:uncharacterized protein LOC131623225 [Vicia villosa]